VSEYRCYEFVALDRPLSAKQMAELRGISTRAEISPTRFWNEYEWGDLKAQPAALMKRYFDAHLYFASWGAHRLMLRLPRTRVDLPALAPYFTARRAARLTSAGEHVLLDLASEPEDIEDDEPGQGSLAALAPLRSELMRGDLRPAYLAWLLAVMEDALDDDAPEPPVPAGLSELTAAQQALVEFLRIDADLIAAAANGSPALTSNREPLHRWLAALSLQKKDEWLKRAVAEPDVALGGELLRAFQASAEKANPGTRRTVGDLRASAEAQRAKRKKLAAARAKKARAAAEASRQRHLTKLARSAEGAWSKLEKLVETSAYDDAVELAIDLRDLATRDATTAAFARRFEALRKRQLRRRGFFDRWKRLNTDESDEQWTR